ncbi:hypothetical protein BJ170DRAFT_601484 [Xylariales sp. AK1849]|nr:hypothetical protein BJ170DRAFT_601484 [Xylariales sp. AK1849]
MPIGDLLAEITGEKASPAPTFNTSSSTGIKRKITTDLKNDGTPIKVAKQSHPASRDVGLASSRSSIMAKPSSSTMNGQRPITTSTSTSAFNGQPYTGTATAGRVIRKPSAISGPSSVKKGINDSPVRPKLNPTSFSASKVPLAKPSPTTPTALGPSKAPKKGSFAEIMARGAKAQEIVPKAGLIQHKAISETVMSKKERDERARKPKWKSAKQVVAAGTASIVPRDKRLGGLKKGAVATIAKGKGRPSSSGSDAPEKKVKKAATATTGYAGTARPPPKKPSESRNGKPASSHPRPPGGLLAPPKSRRRDEYADEDSDMSGFIDDDEDEQEEAPRYGHRYTEYESDGSSDMEAGADDIYFEEQRAMRQAREEDAREEARLEQLRREKEARKRRAGL